MTHVQTNSSPHHKDLNFFYHQPPVAHSLSPPTPLHPVLLFSLAHCRQTSSLQQKRRTMAPTKVIEREAPEVVTRSHAPVRSRLPTALRVPILICLNSGINMLLWEFASNFLSPELGAISKVPQEDDVTSFYSPHARLAMRWLTVCMTWYLSYDCKSASKEKNTCAKSLLMLYAQSTMSRPSLS